MRQNLLLLTDITKGLTVDLVGARNVGIDQVLFNPNRIFHDDHPTFEIVDLIELKKIL